jgi:nucleoside-triphosphatase THEP1
MPNRVQATSVWLRIFWAIWPDNVANFVALVAAIVASSLGLLDIIDVKKLITVTLTILALLAFSLIRDRISRENLIATLRSTIDTNRLLPADRFFSKETPEKGILQAAHHSAYLIQETGSLVAEQCQDELSRILNAGGVVKLVVCLPSPISTTTLAYRNENLDTSAAILNRLDNFHNQIKAIKRASGASTTNLQVRYTPYDIGFTLVMSDAGSPLSDKHGLVRLAGFRVPYRAKLDFAFESRQSPSTTSYFRREFDELFASSTKVIALTAEPKFGKTKIFQELVSLIAGRDDAYYVLSIREYGESDKMSFHAYSSFNPSVKRTFARKVAAAEYPERDIRQYHIDVEVWDSFAAEIREACKQKKLIVIDEIGEMQLQSQQFCESVRLLLARPEISLFATVLLDDTRHPLLRELKDHYRTTVLQLNTENQNELVSELRYEFQQSIRLQEYLKR